MQDIKDRIKHIIGLIIDTAPSIPRNVMGMPIGGPLPISRSKAGNGVYIPLSLKEEFLNRVADALLSSDQKVREALMEAGDLQYTIFFALRDARNCRSDQDRAKIIAEALQKAKK